MPCFLGVNHPVDEEGLMRGEPREPSTSRWNPEPSATAPRHDAGEASLHWQGILPLRNVLETTRPEGELLLACARTQMVPALRQRIVNIVACDPDWERLLTLGAKHRILPLLRRNLQEVCADQIPGDFRGKLNRRLENNTTSTRQQAEELLRLMPLFQAAGVAVIPFKGALLASTIYGAMNLRQVWDIDLLIDPCQLPAARTLLLQQGYVSAKCFDRAEDFVHPGTKLEIDLHCALTPFYFSVDFNFESLWQRRRTYTLCEMPVDSFSPEDLILILCLQVAKDCWERRQHIEYLAKVVDIAELLRARADLDWRSVTEQARHLGLQRILHFGLVLAHTLLGAELPASVCSTMEADRRAVALADRVCRKLFGKEDLFVAKSQGQPLDIAFRRRQLLFYLGLRERRRDWLRHGFTIGQHGLPLLLRSLPGRLNR